MLGHMQWHVKVRSCVDVCCVSEFSLPVVFNLTSEVDFQCRHLHACSLNNAHDNNNNNNMLISTVKYNSVADSNFCLCAWSEKMCPQPILSREFNC